MFSHAEPPPRFEAGSTYTTQSAIDHTDVTDYTVVRRTAKFVTLRRDDGHTCRVGVKTDHRGEWARPEGRYSMAPILMAHRQTPRPQSTPDHHPAS